MESFGNYYVNVIKKIGNGAFGHVEQVELYNLHNKKCDGRYARKIFSPTEEILKSYGVDLNTLRKRFIQEAKYQASCIHSNVAHIYLYNLDIEVPWFIMDLAENDLLTDILNSNISNTERIKILFMILSGLKCVHDKGYLHRDIKPQNVLKFSNDKYCISDFGLVKNTKKATTETELTRIGERMGSGRYMAPEVIAAGVYSIQSDIYALGVVIMDLGIKLLEPIISKCCNYKPTDRYTNIEELENELHELMRVNCND